MKDAGLTSVELKLTREARPYPVGPKKWSIRQHPSFCSVCTNLDDDVAEECFMGREGIYVQWSVPGKGRAVSLTVSMSDVAESASEGCSSCALLQHCATALCPDVFDPTSQRELEVTYCDGARLTIAMDLPESTATSEPQKELASKIEIFSTTDDTGPWRGIGRAMSLYDAVNDSVMIPGGYARLVASDGLTTEGLESVRRWINECKTNHPYCNVRSVLNQDMNVHKWRPKRLVEIASAEQHARLRYADDIPDRYVALTYCWGESGGLVLGRHNETDLMNKIPWDQLARTHQDAIATTRLLGFNYLWVDALCIAQDDDEEKTIEIARMASIYANAYITIAATGSRDGNQGFCHCTKGTVTFHVTEVDGSQSKLFGRPTINHSMFDWSLDGFEKRSSPSEYPLMKRGWTFQERLLSPRILHFTQSELVWECLGMTSCECGALDMFRSSTKLLDRQVAAGVAADIELRLGTLERSKRLAKAFGISNKGGNSSVSRLPRMYQDDYALIATAFGEEEAKRRQLAWSTGRWRNLVNEYSATNLRYVQDTLLAISGLASVWHSRLETSSRYLAGLWEDDLLLGLLWKCVDSLPEAKPREYIAPSWSWACVRRHVDWPTVNWDVTNYHVSILDVSCALKSASNLFGQVSDGCLKLKGPCIKTVCRIPYNFPETYAKAIGDIISPGRGDSSELQADDSSPNTRLSFYFTPDSIPEALQLHGDEILCVRWCTNVTLQETGDGYERALALRRSSQDPEVFQRVGMADFLPKEAEWRDFYEEMTITIV